MKPQIQEALSLVFSRNTRFGDRLKNILGSEVHKIENWSQMAMLFEEDRTIVTNLLEAGFSTRENALVALILAMTGFATQAHGLAPHFLFELLVNSDRNRKDDSEARQAALMLINSP